MTKTVSTSKKPRKQHSPEFRSEALKLAERIGVTAAARELSLYESQLYNWRSKQQNQQTYLIISSAITIAGDGTVGVAVSVRNNLKIRISLKTASILQKMAVCVFVMNTFYMFRVHNPRQGDILKIS
mgnify:FL=1